MQAAEKITAGEDMESLRRYAPVSCAGVRVRSYGTSRGVRMCRQVLLSIALWTAVAVAVGEEVTPREEATSGVVARDAPSTTDGIRVGKLMPDQSATILDSVPYWYKVLLPDGVQGFVSKRWVRSSAGPETAGRTFAFHVVDVGIGDGVVRDVGEREIIVDGGMSPKVFRDYVVGESIIANPVEVAVVTHADSDHWKGLEGLLGLKSGATRPFAVQEFWEPGYDRACGTLPTYDDFIASMRTLVPAAGMHRPLETHHVPASVSQVLTPISLPNIPGVKITVLHSEDEPEGPNCAYIINNASIVMKVEVGGVTMLWTGDANGKLRYDPPHVAPGHVEQKLLAIEQRFPGTLRADILKVGHHGSETANTAAFIAAVAPGTRSFRRAPIIICRAKPSCVAMKMREPLCSGQTFREVPTTIMSRAWELAQVRWNATTRIRWIDDASVSVASLG